MPARAASLVDFSGYIRNFFITDYNYPRNYDSSKASDTYFVTRFNLNMVFTPTDEISVHWRFRAPNMHRWGSESSAFENKFFYGQIKQDWGTIRVGRIDAPDQLGLASLGYLPSSVDFNMTRLGPFDSSTDRDSIWYKKDWENGFGLTAYYTVMSSQPQAAPDSPFPAKWDSDGTYHRFIVEPRYQWEGGGVALGLAYDLNHLQKHTNAYDDAARNYLANQSGKIWSLNPALRLTRGDFSFNFEGKFAWGKQYRPEWLQVSNSFYGKPDGKGDRATGLAFYLNGDYNYGRGNVIISGWWVDGNDIVKRGVEDPTRYNSQKNHALVDMNDNFYPFVVAFASENRFGGRDGVYSGNVNMGGNAIWWANTGMVAQMTKFYNSYTNTLLHLPNSVQTPAHNNDKANHWAIAIHGNHSLTSEIAFSYAVGYMRLVNPNYSVGTHFTSDGSQQSIPHDIKGGQWTKHHTQSKDLGWEIDLGLRLRLLDNLTFATTFGYMFNGDAFKTLESYKAVPASVGNAADPTNDKDYVAVWRKPSNTYSWINTLNFDF
ncbi:hypothetical protein C4J81_02395 [Deltaproteobacteria bacterium Smac51]|nr:hypothetical protein C4J81_02395 [Deltaproteobacteria bacterium Smac51]